MSCARDLLVLVVFVIVRGMRDVLVVCSRCVWCVRDCSCSWCVPCARDLLVIVVCVS